MVSRRKSKSVGNTFDYSRSRVPLEYSYLTNSFANFLSPEFEAHLLPYILFPGAVEIVLALWLLVRGVNV